MIPERSQTQGKGSFLSVRETGSVSGARQSFESSLGFF